MTSQLSSSGWNDQQQVNDGKVWSEIYIPKEENYFHHHQHYNSPTAVYQKKESLENNSPTYGDFGGYSGQAGQHGDNFGVAWKWRGNND